MRHVRHGSALVSLILVYGFDDKVGGFLLATLAAQLVLNGPSDAEVIHPTIGG